MMEKVLKRGEVNRDDTWALEDLYPSLEVYRKDAAALEKLYTAFGEYKGRLGEGADVFLKMLDDYCEMNQLFERLYVYANQKLHEDLGNSESQQMAGETQVMMNVLSSAAAFMVPEILSLPSGKLEEYLSLEPGLAKYSRFLEDIMRQKAHTLPLAMEELLARADELGQGPSNIYSMFNNADIRFEDVTNAEGETMPLTQGRYIMYLESPDRELRKQAFQNLYKSYSAFQNTMGALFDANARQADFFAKEKKYANALEAALDASNIPTSVYDRLIESVHSHQPLLHRYMSLRKKVLGVDELHMYDIYVPVARQADKKFTFEEAKEMVLKALSPLGSDYVDRLKEGFDSRWIDVYENQGKRTGAYSWGAYGIHPYVLLNYQGNLNNVFTLAHEMGHALHSYYSDEAQPYIYAGYKIFVAEVASTCNEALMIDYCIKNAAGREEKAYFINYFLEQVRTTLFRQTMFAEFEKAAHSVVERGGTLNAQVLCDVYYNMNKNYFGEDVVCDDEIRYEWERIPHFYTPFYVYQYATGFSAAIAISRKILNGEEGIVEKYKEFLSGGCSKDPIELLKICGVDMTSPQPVDDALQMFGDYLEELSALL